MVSPSLSPFCYVCSKFVWLSFHMYIGAFGMFANLLFCVCFLVEAQVRHGGVVRDTLAPACRVDFFGASG